MSICGDGALKDSIDKEIVKMELGGSITMGGVLDFATELVPVMKENADLFVCCHRQGDPSCTYLETMGCGVPIIGYNNDAFAGIVKYSNAGWITEMDNPKLLASQIAEISRNEPLLKERAFQSLRFAEQHTFEKTFDFRIDHIHHTLARTQ